MEMLQQTSALIKEASGPNHQLLEKKVVQLLKNIRNEQDYASLLHSFYSYFSVLEAKIDRFITPDTLPDYLQRRKAARLAGDMQALGFEVVQDPGVRIPEITNRLEAMAALYVAEGATMGGSVIVKMLQQKGIERGLSFFGGYGAETPRMWQAFLHILNALPESEADRETMIRTVKATFDYFYLSLQDKEADGRA